MGKPYKFGYLLTKFEGIYSHNGREKMYSTKEVYETYLPQNDI